MRSTIVLCVIIGGGIGAAMRYETGVIAALCGAASDLPAILIVNVIGAAILGFLHGRDHPLPTGGDETIPLLDQPMSRSAVVTAALLGTGLCGALTTFSHLAVEMVALLASGAIAAATGWVIVWLIAGLGAARGGITLGKRWHRRC
jgi:CrcB protein